VSQPGNSKGSPPREAVSESGRHVRLFIDPYEDWTAEQKIPVHEDYGIDLLAIETAPWALYGIDGALVHLKGRGDFMTMFLLDLPEAGRTVQMRHLFEAVAYVVEGQGSTQVETSDGRTHSFEWGPRSLFALPLNAKYRIFNGSGRARVVICNNFPLVKNLFHNDRLIFHHDFGFPEREGEDKYFAGDGDFIPGRPGWNLWETNFVPDVGASELHVWEQRGAGSSNIQFLFTDAVMKAHCSAMPVGTYKKAHRHGPDFSIFHVSGSGYSLMWYEGAKDFVRVDWRHGVVFAPHEMMFHQHFNTGPQPARYLAVALGSVQHPFLSERKRQLAGVDVDVKAGGRQIEYRDQDPRIHTTFLAELAKHGVQSRMGQYFDDAALHEAIGSR
jgi:hypothetical protein